MRWRKQRSTGFCPFQIIKPLLHQSKYLGAGVDFRKICDLWIDATQIQPQFEPRTTKPSHNNSAIFAKSSRMATPKVRTMNACRKTFQSGRVGVVGVKKITPTRIGGKNGRIRPPPNGRRPQVLKNISVPPKAEENF